MAKKTIVYAFLLFLFFLFTIGTPHTMLFAQTGAVGGHVTDAQSKEPLIGATVVLQGTATGAVTDADGYFRIEGIRPGAYSLSASYLSYQTDNRAGVEISDGQETIIDIALREANVELQNIAVVALRRLSSEMAVLQTIRNSLPVASGISAQQISKTQDSDAAEALRRIPGITLADDRFIVVRGLAQRYNNVWLNEAATPSGETDSRAFSFDVLPTSLIDYMMIFKSPSAELPADFSGGFVRISTRNIPEGNTFQVAWQTGYNTQASFRNFQLAEGYAADYFASGAAARRLPADMPAHLNDVSTAEAANRTQQINTGWKVRNFTALPEQKLALTLNRSFTIGNTKIGNITNLNYATGYDYFETENNNYLSYDSKNDLSSYRFRYNDVQYRNTVKVGALFNWSLVTENKKFELRNFFNRRGTASLSQRQGTDYYSDEDIRRWESIYTSRTTYSGQLSGSNQFRNNAGKADWTAGYAYANYSEPDRKDVKSTLHTHGGESRYYVSDPTRYYQDLSDHSVSFSTNYERPFFSAARFSPTLRAGMYGEYKERTFAARRFIYNLLGSGYNRYADWEYTSVFPNENIAADKIYLKESTNKSDAYNAGQTLGAAYLSAKLNYGKKLDIDMGMRMEYYGLKLNGYESDGIKPVAIDESAADWFPSVHVAYNFHLKHLLRLAYGRSVNRPEFREIVPYVYYDFALNANLSGMPGLKNAYTDNLDMRYEFYPSPTETLMAGVFYKSFRHPIEQTYNEAGSGLQYTYHNAQRAEACGAEIELKKQLGFIGLEKFNFVFNAAYIYSRVYFPEGSFERDRPMQGQSPYLLNAGLFYQHDEKGLSASLLYNRIGRRIESVGVPMQNPNDDIPDIYEMPRHSVDFSLSQKIGSHLEIKAGIKDLFNARIEYKQFLVLTDPATHRKREVEQLVRSFRPGMTANISLSLKF
ncbi:MAG: TonB-dependent receptor [Tannerellaceae bacterium]|jgi:outer membrane receptor for ferrienterochelin and colicin|nr:TonB-dependent receptor [Tannerellaceae bacterium]